MVRTVGRVTDRRTGMGVTDGLLAVMRILDVAAGMLARRPRRFCRSSPRGTARRCAGLPFGAIRVTWSFQAQCSEIGASTSALIQSGYVWRANASYLQGGLSNGQALNCVGPEQWHRLLVT